MYLAGGSQLRFLDTKEEDAGFDRSAAGCQCVIRKLNAGTFEHGSPCLSSQVPLKLRFLAFVDLGILIPTLVISICSVNSEYGEAVLSLAMTLRRKGLEEEAEDALRKLIEVDPENVVARNMLEKGPLDLETT